MEPLRIALVDLHAATHAEERGDGTALSFIVPAFQAELTLAASIASIRAAAPAGSEIIVVNDGSLDNTGELAEQLADITLHQPCQAGAARCRNDGARAARGGILFFVDADVTVSRAAVEGMVRHFETGADAVFGAYEPLPPPNVANRATTYKNVLHHYTHLMAAGNAATFWSGFGAVRRDAFRAVQGFDVAVTTGADVEDIHLGYRLRLAGYEIVLDPTLQVQHHKRYTVMGVMISDVEHRAIPWTRAMLSLRRFSPDLNLGKQSLLSAAISLIIPLAGLAALWWPGPGLAALAALIAVWFVRHRRFLLYTAKVWNPQGALFSACLLYFYYLYGAFGAAVGTGAYVLRPGPRSVLNSFRLDQVAPHPSEIIVTVSVIVQSGEPLAAVAALPPPEPWWELIVCSAQPVPDMPEGAQVLIAREGASRAEMRHMALLAARGEVFATLDASCAPVPGWLDRVRAMARTPCLIIAGPFHHDRRSVRSRAAQVVRYWHWRPERCPGWAVFHPNTNAAFRTEVAKRLGGFRVDGALILRMAGFGARPVRFDAEMGVQLKGRPTIRSFVPGAAGVARLRASTTVRYFDVSRLHRIWLVLASPVSTLVDLQRIVRAAVSEGSADRTFWLAMPLIVVGRVSAMLGRGLGLLRPMTRGGVVPRTVTDFAAFEHEQAPFSLQ